MLKGNYEWKPTKLWWVITAKCNLNCAHCYLKYYEKTFEEISEREWEKVISKISEYGIKEIYLSGGEPFLLKY